MRRYLIGLPQKGLVFSVLVMTRRLKGCEPRIAPAIQNTSLDDLACYQLFKLDQHPSVS